MSLGADLGRPSAVTFTLLQVVLVRLLAVLLVGGVLGRLRVCVAAHFRFLAVGDDGPVLAVLLAAGFERRQATVHFAQCLRGLKKRRKKGELGCLIVCLFEWGI